MVGESAAQLGGLLTGLVPGARVAGYLLERLVGVGGMAVVFRARDERLGRVVALKLLTGDEVVRRRFAREARAVAAVDHPHIIPVYEAGEEGSVLFIAMRFVAGDDLRVVVRREGGLRVRRAAAFISPVASALDAAHSAGLVHRDVKPANMLVDVGPGRPEHVYLSDFGLARGILSSGGLTRAGQFLGTPDYASPEQISGRTVDGRADQYALACVAYTLLSGAVPFQRDEPMATLYAHLSVPPPLLTATRPDLSAAVDEVLAQGLAKAPEDRFDSCGDFADALRDALDVEPYDPSRPGRPPHHHDAVHPDSAHHDQARRVPAADQRTLTAEPVPGEPVPGERVPGERVPGEPVPAQREKAPAPPSRASATAKLTIPPDPPAPSSSDPPLAPTVMSPVAATGTWIAVISADRAYFNSIQAVNEQDAASIRFPDPVPVRRFRLTGDEVRIGRRSATRHIEPEIDLTGPPPDTGVSRLHASLIAGPDRTWSVVDRGSPNGILVNGKEVPAGESVPLRDGDRIHLGAWTVITITRG